MALALDVDGFVVTGQPPWHALLEADMGIDPASLHSFFQGPFNQRVLGQADLEDLLTAELARMKAACSARELIDYWFARDARVDSVLLDAVERWKANNGGRCCLATTQEPYRAKYLWEQVGLRDVFDSMVYSAELGCKKPDGGFFREAAARWGSLSPETILLFDDRRENIDGALSAGWQAELYRGPLEFERRLGLS